MKHDPPRRRTRILSEAEIELWHQVARTVVPREGASLPALTIKQQNLEAEAIKPVLPQAATPVLPPRAPAPPALAPLDPKMRQKLARGRLTPERSIDLHGMFQQQAFVALQNFLVKAQREGIRLVLVVTGKGDGNKGEGKEAGRFGFSDSAREPGVLRRNVPLWLGGVELRPIVIGFEEAGRLHGGGGALYVRLRRVDRVPIMTTSRKKGAK
ncbi:Smr/MutS family protein [Beijerinckia indica]|uniref:Smr protein/MutS2 n=1 Tax=Beijerinckia indica subsp. indica (strain ATCC 9039 / DSM 1715 / NCIMB 8712) TaxID=395963 RepID=B2IC77_BEII9|nr:Smr/MutS family protein [Beijerinckia indica]ACB96674.1 Smr protein/MutS2 [Beijerinckia indica subsp. indica ATCC 9039]